MAEATTTVQQDDIIARLKLSGAWFAAAAELEFEGLISKVAADEGVAVSDDELQSEFDAFRADLDLFKAEETNAWLADSGITVEQVEAMLESNILQAKLADKLIDDAQIDAHYNQNPAAFDYAEISQLVVDNSGAAGELALSIREEGEDFAALAAEHSLDDSTSSDGGYLGLISREEAGGLPGDIADRIFAASESEVIGPFEVPGGGHLIIRVEEVGKHELDDDLRAVLRGQLFDAHMAQLADN
ncbi:Foldase protein PrsA precursor [Symmachiella dynata]|uniref:peptidylprolyl isomerase n=1 Tax=Symmachiella dynata TaxID=2527995 RepID=A0A517ZYD9_9PLAN|nr:peptidyl-prolyl cis-trans isomerase [Symmachiella dynata]QDU47494.1 Foldase protein PrsA precursor [Symmachiella dynata]